MELIAELGHYDKVFVYMPTWRDSQNDFVAAGFDFETMESVLSENNALLLVKPHSNTFIDPGLMESMAHVKLLPSTLDIYPILPYTDVLITDYSSIMYDYILMEKKDVILYLFDYQEYVSERPFIWPYDEMSYGHRAYDFGALLDLVRDATLRPDEQAKALLVDKCWGDSISDSCKRIGLFFQQC